MQSGRKDTPVPSPEDEATRPIDLRKYARESALAEEDEEEDRIITAEISVDLRGKEVPRVTVPASELPDRLLNHREAFVVSLVDGVTTVDMLLSIAGMSHTELLSILTNLRARGVLKFD